MTFRLPRSPAPSLRPSPADALSPLPPPEKVHFQHTAAFISHLVAHRANYTLQVPAPDHPPLPARRRLSPASLLSQIYPDESHFLRAPAARLHLGRSLVSFFQECFAFPEAAVPRLPRDEGEDDS